MASSTAVPAGTAFTVTPQDGDSSVWQRTDYVTNAAGRVIPKTRRYVELTSGLNHLVNGQWNPSSENITILPDGTAAATNGQHQAFFPGNINQGVIKVVTPDQEAVYSRPTLLCYVCGTNYVVLATLKDSFGQLVDSNKVAYADAFDGLKATLLYTYKKSGFSQNLVLQQRPPNPAAFGLDAQSTKLELLTEFVSPIEPTIGSTALKANRGLADNDLSFGKMVMVQGSAFATTNWLSSNSTGVPVYKDWQHLQDRTFLVEKVDYLPIAPKLQGLAQLAKPDTNVLLASSVLNKPSSTLWLPPARWSEGGKGKFLLAKADNKPNPSLILDYDWVTATTGSITFQSDVTYLISQYLFTGTNTVDFEGGTVIKFGKSSGSGLDANWTVFQSEPYRPVIFTALDDDSVGETISGSTGTPSGYYDSLIRFFNYGADLTIHDVVLKYLNGGFMSFANTMEIDNIQAINCNTPIIAFWDNVTVNNGLFYNNNTVIGYGGGAPAFYGNQITVHNCGLLSQVANNSLVNSIIVNTTNLVPSGGTLVTNCTVVLPTDTGVFQVVGGGMHYLATNSPYRNAGTNAIDATLLAELSGKTTWPPVIFSPPGISVSTNLNLVPQATRDTNSSPDLGYHYDPLDYIFGTTYLTNGSIIINPGTAVGVYSTNSYGYAISIANNATLICTGQPNNLVHIADYREVQENIVPGWKKPTYASICHFNGTNSIINCRFTDWSVIAQDFPHIQMGSGGPFWFRENQFHGGQIITWLPTINFTNCLFERVNCDIEPGDANLPVFRNNTVFGGTFGYGPWNVTNAVIKDNLFDGPTIPDWLGGSGVTYDGGYNAYVTNCNTLDPLFPTDLILSNSPAYQSSWLGDYYLPPDSPLINAGSLTADKVGLYQFTTQTNQTKEGFSYVDIGYHYVALDTNTWQPVTTYTNGIPDYIADSDGNGLPDWWEMQNFGHLGNDANGDADGDGYSNYQEYVNGTNPNVLDQPTQVIVTMPGAGTIVP